jgi:hypothetical protein
MSAPLQIGQVTASDMASAGRRDHLIGQAARLPDEQRQRRWLNARYETFENSTPTGHLEKPRLWHDAASTTLLTTMP